MDVGPYGKMEAYPLDALTGAACVMTEKITLKEFLVPMSMVADRIAGMEDNIKRLQAEVKRLSKPDFYWDDQGEEFDGGEHHFMYDGHVEVVSCAKSLGFRYAVYIPTSLDPETDAFEDGEVEYFDSKVCAERAREDAVSNIEEARGWVVGKRPTS